MSSCTANWRWQKQQPPHLQEGLFSSHLNLVEAMLDAEFVAKKQGDLDNDYCDINIVGGSISWRKAINPLYHYFH
jgi:hypothetical protein